MIYFNKKWIVSISFTFTSNLLGSFVNIHVVSSRTVIYTFLYLLKSFGVNTIVILLLITTFVIVRVFVTSVTNYGWYV